MAHPKRGPSARAVEEWARSAFVLLSLAAVAGLLAAATADWSYTGLFTTPGPLSEALYLAAGLVGLIGVPVTLVAVILAVVRASRNQQWRWLAAILLGTVLPLPVAGGALAGFARVASDVFNAYPLNAVQSSTLLIGVSCVPLATLAYGVISGRQNLPSLAGRLWITAFGPLATLVLTVVMASLASGWLPPRAPAGAPVLATSIASSQAGSATGTELGSATCPYDGTAGYFPNLYIENGGGGELIWQAHTDDPGIQLDPSSGAEYGNHVSLADVSLSGGSQQSTVTVTIHSNGGNAQVVLRCELP